MILMLKSRTPSLLKSILRKKKEEKSNPSLKICESMWGDPGAELFSIPYESTPSPSKKKQDRLSLLQMPSSDMETPTNQSDVLDVKTSSEQVHLKPAPLHNHVLQQGSTVTQLPLTKNMKEDKAYNKLLLLHEKMKKNARESFLLNHNLQHQYAMLRSSPNQYYHQNQCHNLKNSSKNNYLSRKT